MEACARDIRNGSSHLLGRWGALVSLLLAMAKSVVAAGGATAAPGESPPFRLAFSSSMFSDVNETDARAAVMGWGQMLARDVDVPTDPTLSVLRTIDALEHALRAKEVDAVGMTLTEFAAIRHEVAFGRILVNQSEGEATERYVLLAHRDGPVQGLADLSGRSVLFHANPRSCLAEIWLDTLLLKQGRAPVRAFAGNTLGEARLSKVVLPVFFRRVDACVATRRGYDTLCELNPQLARQLVVLAESQEIVPSLFAFRADYHPSFEQTLFTALQDLTKTPSGQQVLTIFQSQRIAEVPVSHLEPALTLLEEHARLRSRHSMALDSGASAPPAEEDRP
jgi:ABC-type phosphate/phosphonate transport system substrate-binding protein